MMNKQELIERLKKRLATGIAYDTSFAGTLKFAIALAEQLDEPSREECELISNEYNICSCCSYNLNNLIKEIVVGCDNDDNDDFECGGAVVHQVFWTDKYMNYCPNCGRKIKREKGEEFEIDRLKELLYISNKDELIDRLLMQERQKVIEELEEWVNENRHEVTASVGGFDYYVNDTEDLNQKLKEMKG